MIEGGEAQEEWRPQNITKRFYGPTPMREGLVRSRNLVSIRLLRGMGIGYAIKHIATFGFGAEAMPANLTLALGTGQVTPLEMARGFAVFANGGISRRARIPVPRHDGRWTRAADRGAAARLSAVLVSAPTLRGRRRARRTGIVPERSSARRARSRPRTPS